MAIYNKYFNDYIKYFPNASNLAGFTRYNNNYYSYLDINYRNKLKIFFTKYLFEIKNSHDHYDSVLKFILKNNLKKLELPLQILVQPYNYILPILDDIEDNIDEKILLPKLKKFNKLFYLLEETLDKSIKLNMTIPKIIVKDNILKIEKNFNKTKINRLKKKLKKNECRKEIEIFIKNIANIKSYLSKKYLIESRPTIGLLDIDKGKLMYKYFILFHTTMNLSPSSIHKLGLKELKRIDKEIKKMYKNNPDVSIPNLKENQFKSSKEMLNYYKKLKKRISEKFMQKYFDKKIKNDFKIKGIPDHMKNQYGAYYILPSYNFKRCGTFYLNIHKYYENYKYIAWTLILHEGNPGHHYQLTYNLENKVPKFILYNGMANLFNSYVEGWGLYVESLTHEYFGDSNKKEEIDFRYGCYEYDKMRALRLVIDTGIHYYGWKYKKCSDLFKKYTNLDKNEIKREIYRYISLPGQALAYKIGEIEIKKIKKKFKGSDKEFHNKFLELGPMPLNMLKKYFS